jgi:hypothetical protein
MCGPRLGEPICLTSIVFGLAKGQAAIGTEIIENARKELEQRVSKTIR